MFCLHLWTYFVRKEYFYPFCTLNSSRWKECGGMYDSGWRNLPTGLHQGRMVIDRLEGGQGMSCVCMCVPEWGVVDVFTMGNEPISRPLRGGRGGVISGNGGGCAPCFLFPNVGHFPSSGDFPCVSVGTITILHPPKTPIKSLNC